MRVLLDTSALIALERGEQSAQTVMAKLAKEDIFVAAIAAAEFYTGTFRIADKEKRLRAHAFLAGFTVLPFTLFMAFETGTVRAERLRGGSSPGFADELIAGTAIEWNIDVIITENKKHFANIPALKGKVKSFSDF